jgi:CPA2 family monovalent cation:H+ antiporter-2
MKRVNLPAIPAYILIGLILGKSGFGIFGDDEISRHLGYIGLIFLLFYVGLELKPEAIAKGSRIVVSGLIDFNVNFIIGFILALALGFSYVEAFAIGAAFYISSSAVVFQSLIENRKLVFSESETVIWLMIFEDILLIFMVFVISAKVEGLFLFVVKTFVFIGTIFIAAKFLKDHLIAIFARDDEIPVLFTFSIVLSVALLSKLLGVSEILSVIVLGSALSEIGVLERLSQPFKDVFLVLFFFFFGVSVDLWGKVPLFLASLAVIAAIGGKVLSGLFIGKTIHGSYDSGFEIGASTIARGEFSILIASLQSSEHVSALITLMVIATSLIGSLTARYSFKLRKIIA